MARFELSDSDRAQIVSGVSCALLLERAGFLLDKKESSRDCLKYRHGSAGVIIVNHGGRGWWDAGSDAKGDVFTLIRHLNPGLGWRQACVDLGSMIGVEPEGAVYVREQSARKTDVVAPGERWEQRKPLQSGSKVWTYLTEERALPEWVVTRAVNGGAIKDGIHAAWFCHRDAYGDVCGAELRGPETHLCLSGSKKTLFRFYPGGAPVMKRLVICEAAIEALSFAALDSGRTRDTLYTSTAGGMGPDSEAAIKAELQVMASLPGAELVIAMNNDEAGNRYAARLASFAEEAGVACRRKLPAWEMNDFNDVLKRVVAENKARAA